MEPSKVGHIQSSMKWEEVCHCKPSSLGYASDASELAACENSCHTYKAPDCPATCETYQQNVIPSIYNVHSLR